MSDKLNIPIDDAYEVTHLSSTFICSFENIPELCELHPRGKFIDTDPIVDIGQFMMNANVYFPCGCHELIETNYDSLFLRIIPIQVRKCFHVVYIFKVFDGDGNHLQGDPTTISSPGGPWLGIGSWNLANSMNGDKTVDSLRVELDLTVVTERFYSYFLSTVISGLTLKTYLCWKKLHPDKDLKKSYMDHKGTALRRDIALGFYNQSFDDNEMALVEVNEERKKLLKISKEIVCNVSKTCETRLTKTECMKGKVDWIKSEVCELIEKSLKIENAMQCFIRANQSNATDLARKCFDICVTNYHQLKTNEEWNEFAMNHNRLFVEIFEAGAISPHIHKNVCGSKSSW